MTLVVTAQVHVVSGKVSDLTTGSPIQDVTVYINGTTKGSITDYSGNFEIRKVSLPCELILSHVSYGLVSHSLKDPAGIGGLSLNLEPAIFELEEVQIKDQNQRERQLEEFKHWFLGINYEKLKAEILNDSVLFFNIMEEGEFDVSTTAPIMVKIPQTGYILSVDLLKFNVRFKEDLQRYHCSMLGTYYFREMESRNWIGRRLVARRRAHTYYNSRLHFCRSLYQDKLAENGYELFGENCSPEHESAEDGTAFLSSRYGQDEFGNPRMEINNVLCENYWIVYYSWSNNSPCDLSSENLLRYEFFQSELIFLGEPTYIYPSGRIPDNSMLFGGSIGLKGVASMLPDDYIPSMQ